MSFLGTLFHTNKHTAESVVLVDIGTNSVAGAYVRYTEQESPVLLYTRRVPIEIREGEPHGRAMLRALKVLGDILITEGAPVLARASGSGSVNTILVSIDAPWQETSVRTEYFERNTSFVFTKSLVTKALEKTAVAIPEKLLADESIIGTALNGYETANPYGKRAHRASVIVLTSLIEEKIAASIFSLLKSLYHTKRVLFISGSSPRYQAMRVVFPHERNALILDATGTLTSIALVRNGFFVALSEVAHSAIDSQTWVHEVVDECAEIAKNYPLPRTIFLLARESEISSLQEKLTTANFGSLWLSDNPPNIVSILASHLSGSIQHLTTASPDLMLLLMTKYYQHHDPEEKV